MILKRPCLLLMTPKSVYDGAGIGGLGTQFVDDDASRLFQDDDVTSRFVDDNGVILGHVP